MNTRTRVKAVPVLLAASLGLGSLNKVLAHKGHMLANLQPTGFPELTLVIEEAGVTGMPDSIEAGRYLVKVTGPELDPERGPSGVIFAQLPEGITAEGAYEQTMAATDGYPEFYLDTFFGGGVAIVSGTEAWVIADLTPGAWHATTLGGSTLAVPFEVTGEFPADVATPEADVVLDMFEMDFKILEGEFVAGDNVVTVRNSGAQIHFSDISRVPDGTTEEQVEALFNSFMTGTPDPNAIAEDAATPVGLVPEQSGGTEVTLQISLEPGTYLFTCWAADPETGMPHAMMGMHELITVGE
ncbi:MAG: hypothetical protein M9934_00990 [Thermomicrobiales bacterium]|nr:hypothetical protein [Thermomicrobiales bacterium]